MSPAEIEAAYAPRIAEAATRDAARRAAAAAGRDAALVDSPRDICGLPVRRLTLDDYLILTVLGNAHVTRVEPPAAPAGAAAFWAVHHAQFVWWLSPEYLRTREARERFILSRIAPLPYAELAAAIDDYLREMFADAPRPRGASLDSSAPRPSTQFSVSFAIHWIARLAAAFHWSRAEIRALPLPELFQYLAYLAAHDLAERGSPLPFALDGEADRLWAEMMAEMNAAAAQPKAAA